MPINLQNNMDNYHIQVLVNCECCETASIQDNIAANKEVLEYQKEKNYACRQESRYFLITSLGIAVVKSVNKRFGFPIRNGDLLSRRIDLIPLSALNHTDEEGEMAIFSCIKAVKSFLEFANSFSRSHILRFTKLVLSLHQVFKTILFEQSCMHLLPNVI